MMDSKTFRALALDACTKLHGEAFNEEVFSSAFEKLKRHMKNKYGSVDWETEHDEGGVDNLLFFYKESAKATQRTWNGAKAAKPVASLATKKTVAAPVAAAPVVNVDSMDVDARVAAAEAILNNPNASEADIERALAILAA